MLNENNKHSWCVNAEHGMSANNDGSTKMCCMIQDSYNNMLKDNKPMFIGVSSILENFNNPASLAIRQNLQNGIRDNACKWCWQEEDSGRKSKRMRDNERYEHEVTYDGRKPFNGLAKLELNLGNNCNIKCRTCHPSISSMWMKEAYDLDHKTVISFKDYSNNMKKYHQQYDDDSSFWDDLIGNLSTIKQFDFYGGEPFLSKKMWEILQICVDKGYSQEIELHFNTNGTVWPDQTDIFKNFKFVNLSFSIDGTKEKFEYMRYLAKWDEVQANMELARQHKDTHGNMSISWCITLSTINIYDLPEILDEYYKNYTDFGMYLNLVHGPIHYNISKLPMYVRDKVIERLENVPKEYESVWYQLPGIINFMKNGTYDEKIWGDFNRLIKKHDDYRKQDFASTFPEYNKVIG